MYVVTQTLLDQSRTKTTRLPYCTTDSMTEAMAATVQALRDMEVTDKWYSIVKVEIEVTPGKTPDPEESVEPFPQSEIDRFN